MVCSHKSTLFCGQYLPMMKLNDFHFLIKSVGHSKVTNYYKIISYKKTYHHLVYQTSSSFAAMSKKVVHVFQKEISTRHPILENSDIKLLELFTNKLIESPV